jgi:hypothetical protein
MEAAMTEQRWQDAVLVFIGGWVLLSPWIIPYVLGSSVTGAAAWSHYITGLMIAATGIVAFGAYQIWEEWVNILLGLWLVISPWVLNFTHVTVFTWNAVAAGAIVLTLSAWALLTAPESTNRR